MLQEYFNINEGHRCILCVFKYSMLPFCISLSVKYIPLQRINAQQMQELTPTKNASAATESKFIPKGNKYRKHLCQFCG